MAEIASESRYLGRITPGMEVCDVTGDKVGSIAHIYRFDDAADPGLAKQTGDEIIEVRTGFMGMGKHLFIPLSAVQEVLTDAAFLSKSRQSFGELGYDRKPAHLTRLH